MTLKFLKKVSVLFFLLGIFLIVGISEAKAETYYVDATDGLNTNDGTSQDAPWQTLAKVNGFTFSPGDNIYFKRGETWSDAGGTGGKLAPGQSGSAEGGYITYGAYGTGSDPIIDATGQNYGIDVETNKSYLKFQDIQVQDATTGQILLYDTISNVQINSMTLSGGAIGINISNGTISNISITDTTISDFSGQGINIGVSITDLIITGTQVSSGPIGLYIGTGTTDTLSINSSSFSNLTNYGFQQENVAIIDTLNISSSHFDNNTNAGLYLAGDLTGLTVTDSFFNSNSSGTANGLWISPASGKTAQTISISGTQANSNGSKGFFFGGAGSGSGVTLTDVTAQSNSNTGINVQNSWTTFTISNSTFSSNSSDGIQFYLNSASSSQSAINISGVTSSNNGSSGFQFLGTTGSGTDATLNNVTVSNNGTDGINIKGNWTDIDILNCVVETNGTTGLDSDGDGISYHTSTTGTIKYCFINNNLKSAVAHVNDSDVDMMYNVFSHDTNGTIALVHLEGTGTFNFYNNVVYSAAQTGTGIYLNSSTINVKNNIVYGFDLGIEKDSGTITEDYNLVYHSATNNWSGLSQGDNSLSDDPLFVNPGSDDFSLQSTSPAINTGTNLGSDYDDAIHPSSTFPSSITTVDQDLRGSGWEIGTYIYPVPQAPTIGTPTALSSSSIRWNLTDNANDETGFRLYDNTDRLITSSATANLSYLDETRLSENTQYSGRYITAYNDYGNSTSSSTASSIYTLVDTPTNLFAPSIDIDSISLSVDSFPNDTSGSSGYYFSRSATANSGWIQTNSWQDTELSCVNSYNYTIKYRNGDGTETDSISTTKSPNCKGGGLPPVIYNPPSVPTPNSENPQGGFRILINDNAKTTDNRKVVLKLFADSDTKRMAISNNPDFSWPETGQIPFQSLYDWDLCYWQKECLDGTYTVYAKFFTQYGRASEVVSHMIVLRGVEAEESAEQMTKKEILTKIAEILKKVIQLYTQLIQILKA